ncbi:MAG: sensor histidine kinase [Spirochaetota bacterium]
MNNRRDPRHGPVTRALLITVIYLAVGTAWILFSDHLASTVAGEASRLAAFQRAKGLVYIALTGAGLFLLIAHQMRDLQRSERVLEENRREREELAAYLDAIIEAAPVAIFDLDEDLRVHRLWNPAAQRLFGFTTEEAVGTSPPIIEGEAANQVAELRLHVAHGAPIPRAELTLSRRDGSTFPAMIAAASLSAGRSGVTVVIVSDITALQETMTSLESAIDEREVLLREIHHRVKNNLQIISSLLMLERHGSQHEQAVEARADRTLSRIRTIARIHEQLYHGKNLAQVELTGYLEGLTSELSTAYDPDRRVTVERRMDEVVTDLDGSLPMGLLVHELVVNCYQHALGPEGRGTITLSLDRRGEDIVLAVGATVDSDSASAGSGVPALGRTLVQALVRQMDGEIVSEDANGTSVVIRTRP